MKRYIVCCTCGVVLFTGCYAAPYKEYSLSVQQSNAQIAEANKAYYQYLTAQAQANAIQEQHRLNLQAKANAQPLVEMIPDGKGGFITRVNRQDANLPITPITVLPPPSGFIRPAPPEMESKAAVEFGKTAIWGGAAMVGLHGLWKTIQAFATPPPASNSVTINKNENSGNTTTKTETVTEDNDTVTANQDNDTTTTATETNTETTTVDSYNTTEQTATATSNYTTTETITDDHHTEENGNDNSTTTWQPVEPVDNSGGAAGAN